MNTSVQVLEVGSHWGVACDGFIVKILDTYNEAVKYAAHVKGITG